MEVSIALCKFKSCVYPPSPYHFPHMGTLRWEEYSTVSGANLDLLIKALLALFTGAAPAPKGKIGYRCELLRLPLGVVLSQM